MTQQKDYTSTLLRMAGNIAAGLASRPYHHNLNDANGRQFIAEEAWDIAKRIHALALSEATPRTEEPPRS